MWVAGAVVVGGVAGAAISADAAGDAADKASKSSKEALGFEKEKYEDWQSIYGPIEANLSKFYASMTPESLAAQSISEYNKQNEIAIKNTNEMLAQRGMLSSGAAAATKLTGELAGAEQRANIRATADEVVAAEQGRFLQIGLGQNPGASYSQALQNKAITDAGNSARADAAYGQAVGTAITEVGTALQDYTRRNNSANTVQDVGTINTGASYGNIA